MNKTIVMSLMLVVSAAGISFAGDNDTGNAPNPPVTGQNLPNGNMDNSDGNTDMANSTTATGSYSNTTP